MDGRDGGRVVGSAPCMPWRTGDGAALASGGACLSPLAGGRRLPCCGASPPTPDWFGARSIGSRSVIPASDETRSGDAGLGLALPGNGRAGDESPPEGRGGSTGPDPSFGVPGPLPACDNGETGDVGDSGLPVNGETSSGMCRPPTDVSIRNSGVRDCGEPLPDVGTRSGGTDGDVGGSTVAS